MTNEETLIVEETTDCVGGCGLEVKESACCKRCGNCFATCCKCAGPLDDEDDDDTDDYGDDDEEEERQRRRNHYDAVRQLGGYLRLRGRLY